MDTGVTPEVNSSVMLHSVNIVTGKSLLDDTQLSCKPVVPASRKRSSRCLDDVSLLAVAPVDTATLVVNSSSSTPTVAVANVGTSFTEDGIGGGPSRGSARSASPRNKEIDDVLLEYCAFTEGSVKCGKKPVAGCKFCDFPFRSQTSFTNHLRKAHGDLNIKPYKCSMCDYRAALKSNLEQHVKFHAKERPFTCSLCGKGFIQKYKLDLHFKFHENKREFACDECDSAFNDQQDLSRHKKNVHFPEETAVKCPTCGRLFKNQGHLDMHVHVHTGEKEFYCEVCNKKYSTRESLRSHMKGHQFQFGCEICSKTLGSYSAFIAHKKLHDPDHKGYKCDDCGKVFLFRATLESHKATAHSTERPFKCDQCPKAFKSRAHLTNHVVCHQIEKPYVCDICGYSVKRRDSLRLHMYKHASVKPYRCDVCHKEYTQKHALEIHVNAKHAGITLFNCTQCEKGFNSNYLLKKHLQKMHNVDVSTQPAPIVTQKVIDGHVEEVVAATAVSDQAASPNAHVCDYCLLPFASEHALTSHLLMDHIREHKWPGGEGSTKLALPATAISTSATGEDSHIISVGETLDIPIAEEVLIVQTGENVLSEVSHGEGAEDR